jgi:hypothetical protein
MSDRGAPRRRFPARRMAVRPATGRVALLLAVLVAACGTGGSPSVLPAGSTSAPTVAAPAVSPAGPPSGTPAGSSPASSPSPAPSDTGASGPPASTATGWPAIGHIYEIVFENHDYGDVIGNPAAPYLNKLAAQYGLATAYLAITHPSEPNYLALWSGSTQGVTDDGRHDFTTGSTLADQIEAAGRTWHVAAENVPPDCFTGSTAKGGADGNGSYARKHEPAISWTSVSGDPGRCANIVDFAHFDPAQGDYWLIVPNMCHDMHDCSVADGDAWLKSFLPGILSSDAFGADGMVLITFDEGVGGPGGGRVATLVISPAGKLAFTSATKHDHYSLLRTIEDVWGMPCLAETCTANTLREFFP